MFAVLRVHTTLYVFQGLGNMIEQMSKKTGIEAMKPQSPGQIVRVLMALPKEVGGVWSDEASLSWPSLPRLSPNVMDLPLLSLPSLS